MEAKRQLSPEQQLQSLGSELEEYRGREQDLMLIITHSPDKTIALDADYQIVLISPSFQKYCHEVFCKKPQIGDDFLTIIQDEKEPFWETHLQRARQGEAHTELISHQIQERQRFFQITFKSLTKNDSIHRILIFCQDITAQHQAEADAREHATNLSGVLRIASAGSWEYDVVERSVRISEEALDILGIQDSTELVLTSEEFLERFVHPDDIEMLRERILYAATQQHNRTYCDKFEYRLLKVDGEVLHMIVRIRFRSNTQGVIYGVTQDITEQKRVQSRLEEQNGQLKKVNAELDNFVYRVSHDLRAPLSSLLGLINIIRLEDDPQQLQEYLHLQEKSVNRLDHFIREIIDLSRNSRLEPRYEEINASELIQEAFSQQTFDSQSDGIDRSAEVKGTRVIVTDRRRLSVILNNLVSNAIRYANMNKPVPFVKVEVESDQERILLRVEDNGIGIEEKHLSKIYEMFFRASESRSGSGLGLYIVKETVDKLGGTVSVASELGKGTQFTVSLPNHA